MNIVPPPQSQMPRSAGFYGDNLLSPVMGALKSAGTLPGMVLNAVPQALGTVPQALGTVPKAINAAAQIPGAAVQAMRSAMPQQPGQGFYGLGGKGAGQGGGNPGASWSAAPYTPLSRSTDQP